MYIMGQAALISSQLGMLQVKSEFCNVVVFGHDYPVSLVVGQSVHSLSFS